MKFKLCIESVAEVEQILTLEETEITEKEYNAMTPEQKDKWRFEYAREQVMELLSYSMEELPEWNTHYLNVLGTPPLSVKFKT